MDGIDVVRFDDIEERVLGVRAIATDQLDALDLGVVKRVGAAPISRAVLRTMDLRNVEKHRVSSCSRWLRCIHRGLCGRTCHLSGERSASVALQQTKAGRMVHARRRALSFSRRCGWVDVSLLRQMVAAGIRRPLLDSRQTDAPSG
jgi:hypothetical protein